MIAQPTSNWQLWTHGEVLREVQGISPRLASWDRKEHRSQIALREYLEDLLPKLIPLPDSVALYLHMQIDVGDPARLQRHHDLENYLTPLFGNNRLDPRRFSFVSAQKRVGGGAFVRIGVARPAPGDHLHAWQHFSCAAGRGCTLKSWKANIRDQLAAQGYGQLPDGAAEVHLAWRGSRSRNWVMLWKPTGDAMGPVLGLTPRRGEFHPNDGRIVFLGLHYNVDAAMKHDVDIGMWWRSAAIASGGTGLH